MSLYVIADLHLGNSESVSKPMGIFGQIWENHTEKIKNNWCLTDNDTIILIGDTSWAMNFEQLKADFDFLDALPGKKIIIKGNHDYWWSTMSKLEEFSKPYTSIFFLHNNSYDYDNIGICGTRGWISEPGTDSDLKVLNREVGRLKKSIESSDAQEKLVFLHYPPIAKNSECKELTVVLKEYNIKTCYYGHLHGYSQKNAITGSIVDGTEYFLVAADFINFTPLKIR